MKPHWLDDDELAALRAQAVSLYSGPVVNVAADDLLAIIDELQRRRTDAAACAYCGTPRVVELEEHHR